MALKMMLLLLIAAFVGLFFINGPNGKPLMTMDDFIPEVPQSLDELRPSGVDTQPSEPTKVYKWKDENGIWQFSNREEDSVVTVDKAVEVMELDGDINIMPAVDIPPAKVRSAGATDSTKSGFSNLPSGLTTVSPDKIGEMMDAVNNLQDTVDQRKQDLDKITDGNN